MQSTVPFSPLSIRLFGPLHVLIGGQPLAPVRTRSILWLLALLTLRHERPISRTWLAGTLWPDSPEKRALQNLRNDLVALRQALGTQAECLQSPTRDTLLFDLRGADVDLLRFDQGIRAGDEASLRAAVAAYAGPLLEGCYEEWVLPEREPRAAQCLSALERLAEGAQARADYGEALGYLRQAETLDPLQESVLRRTMACLAACGEAVAAGEAYRRYRQRLHEECLAAPDRETTLLYQQIRADARDTAQRTAHSATLAPAPNALAPLTSDEPPAPVFAPLRPPHPLTSLIGREAELTSMRALLTQHRLVTLIGAGGVGKTRLATEAAMADNASPSGAIWVELAPLQDGALLLPAVAETLGLSSEGVADAASLLERIVRRLSKDACLLTLDNCEHLLEDASRLAHTLLSRCPALRILATSRQRLGIPGEIAWRVPSLPFPPENEASVAPQDYPAVRLFVERAGAVRPGFRLTGQEDIAAVCRICRRLDGIPLALELAAARAAILPVTQIAARLDDRFRLLTRGNRTAAPRHQTLQAMIDWSYDQLSAPEQALLRGLSLFAGGWTLEAAEAIFDAEFARPDAGGEAAPASEPIIKKRPLNFRNLSVLDLLALLEDKSLVLVEETALGLRYRMLETVREYGHEKLQECGEERATQERYANYFLAWTEAARPFMGHRDRGWQERLEIEHDNLRASLTTFTAHESTLPKAVQMAAALEPFWDARGYFHERRVWLIGLANRSTPPTEARARLLAAAALDARIEGDIAGAKRMSQEYIDVRQQLGDRHGFAEALHGLASVLGEFNVPASEQEPERARALAEESVAVMRELGDLAGIASGLYLLGRLVYFAGDFDLARVHWTECRAVDLERGVKGGYVLYALGELAQLTGDLDTARGYYETFLREWKAMRELGDLGEIASSLHLLGRLAYYAGDFDLARARWTECRAVDLEQGVKGSHVLYALGELAMQTGDFDAARGYYETFLREWHEIGDPVSISWALRGIANLTQAEGEPEKAARLLGAAQGLDEAFAPSRLEDIQAKYQPLRDTLRLVLSEPALEAAWEQGRAMTRDQAVAYAQPPRVCSVL